MNDAIVSAHDKFANSTSVDTSCSYERLYERPLSIDHDRFVSEENLLTSDLLVSGRDSMHDSSFERVYEDVRPLDITLSSGLELCGLEGNTHTPAYPLLTLITIA